MNDLTFTRSGELEVTQIEGETEAGIDFVDGLLSERMVVVDSGRVIVPAGDATRAAAAAAEVGLLVVCKEAL